MGSRGRSIRLRIYFLVAIPLVAMVGLLAYVAGTSVNNAINLDRAPNLINATSLPTAEFVTLVQDERAAAVVYLFRPTPANLAAYDAAVKATDADKPAFLAAMDSPGTKGSETAGEAKAIGILLAGMNQMSTLRAAVTNRAVSPLQALGGYTAGIQLELKLFLAEADSLTNATASAQALGLIATGVGQGGPVGGIRAAVRGAGREQDYPGGPRGLRRDGRDSAGRCGGRGVPA